MIVVDTNILVAIEIETPDTAQAQELLKSDPEWRLPALWRYEFSNVMVTLVKHGRMSADGGRAALRRALARFGPGEVPVDLEAAFDLGLEAGLSGYDACFLVLARTLGVRLVTLDKALVAKSRGTALGLKDYLGEGFVAGEAVPKGWPGKAKSKRGR